VIEEKDAEYMYRVLAALAVEDCASRVFWHASRDALRVTFYVDTTDVFEWGAPDAEEIRPDRLDLLERSIGEVRLLSEGNLGYAPVLFVCRMRCMRPQAASYPADPALWPLIDACGPSRGDDATLRPGSVRAAVRHSHRRSSPPTWLSSRTSHTPVVGVARVPEVPAGEQCHGLRTAVPVGGPDHCGLCGEKHGSSGGGDAA